MENFKTDFEKVLKNNNLSEKEIAFKNFNAKEFSSHGFPNRKDEDWKFSDINQIIKKEIGELNFYNEQLKKSEIDKDILLNEIEHNKLFFVNGQLVQIDFNSKDKGKIEFLDNRNRNYVYIKKKFNIKCERKFEINPKNIVVGFSSKNCI